MASTFDDLPQVEDKETEQRKKRDMDAGLIVIADDRKAAAPEAVKKGGKK